MILADLGAEPNALRASALRNAPDLAGEINRLQSDKTLLEKRLGESAKPITAEDVRNAAGAAFSELRSLVEHLADQSRGQPGRTLGERMLETIGQILNR